jgi:uncharacterized membrane protein (DUF485 family)
MSDSALEHTRGRSAPAATATPPVDVRPGAAVDWEAIEQSPEFEALVARRRRFVLPATLFFFAWYFGFVILAGYAEGFMGHKLYDGFTVGYALALTQFVMVWVLGWLYLRKSDREFDPLVGRVLRRAEETAPADEPVTRAGEVTR